MALTKRLSRVGNSAGLTFDQSILKQVGWEIGIEVEIKVDGEQLILKPHRYTEAIHDRQGPKPRVLRAGRPDDRVKRRFSSVKEVDAKDRRLERS